MEEEHRQVLRRNLERLVDGTHLDPVLTKLVEYGIFSQKMIEKYQLNSPVSERIRDFYMDIQRRGPQAFDKLHEALVATRHFNLAKLIKPEAIIQETNISETNGASENGLLKHRTVPISLPQYMSEESQLHIYNLAVENPDSVINIRECPISVQVKQATQWIQPLNLSIPVYKMTSRPKGYALIINNRKFICNENERYGSEHDSANLNELFCGLGFDVTVKTDLPYEEMKKIIEDFSKKDFTAVDACIVAIMSHGIRTMDATRILGTDGASVPTESVVEKFTNRNCTSLIGKPKIFIFQTCRGNKEQGAVNVNLKSANYEYKPPPSLSQHRVAQDCSEGYKTREHADILIAHSTLPGYKSNRDIYLGTWFIQSICEVFMEYAWCTDVEDMLKMVDRKVAKYIGNQNIRQTSMYENRGFLKLYFNPGLYK